MLKHNVQQNLAGKDLLLIQRQSETDKFVRTLLRDAKIIPFRDYLIAKYRLDIYFDYFLEIFYLSIYFNYLHAILVLFFSLLYVVSVIQGQYAGNVEHSHVNNTVKK